MAFIPVPDTVMVELFFDWRLQRCENTLYYKTSAAPTGLEADELLDLVEVSYATDIMAHLSADLSFVASKATLLTTDSSFVVDHTFPFPVVGSVESDSVPNNVTYAITFQTASRGRSFRGRNYVPGIPLAAIVGTEIGDTLRGQLLTGYSNLRNLVGTSKTWDQQVVSRFHNNVPRTTGVATECVGTGSADKVLDSQRRRLPGRGR